jgi:diaminopimelate epimerase
MNIQFTKAQGTGNDFVILDQAPNNLSEVVEILCDRKRGIGADGVLIVGPSENADVKMRILNPDGSEVSMCGNGARCAGLYAYRKGLVSDVFTMETGAGLLEVEIKENEVTIKMTDPVDLEMTKDIEIDGNVIKGHFINTGVEHFVVFVDDTKNVDVNDLGNKVRYHMSFAPSGTNVNFVSVTGKDSISIRTYERGVEDETLACGTGSVASAIIANMIKDVSSPVKVLTLSGEILTIYFNIDNDKVSNVFMQGPAKIVFVGSIDI